MHVALLTLLIVAADPAAHTASDALPAAVALTDTPRIRLVILDLGANGVDPSLVKTVNDKVAVALQQAQIVDDVVSAADLRAMMNVEAEKRALTDCDVTEMCMAEIAQALGADVLVHGSVGRLGLLYAVNLSIFDAKANRAIAREKAEAARLETLSRRIEYAIKRLALAYEGKSVALAGDEPREENDGNLAFMWAGAGIAALGTVGCVVASVLASRSAATLDDPFSAGATKASAERSHPIFLASAVAGGIVAAGGSGMIVASFLLE